MKVSTEERELLRGLAQRVRQISELPIQQERKRLWLCSNRLRPERAMVVSNPQHGWMELVPEDTLVCREELLRNIEREFRYIIFRHEHIPDDVPIEGVVYVPMVIHKGSYGFESNLTMPKERMGAYHIEPVIKTQADVDRLHPASLEVDRVASQKNLEFVQDIMGDIIPVRLRGVDFCRCGLTRVLVLLRGLEQLMFDMYDNEDMLHQMMAFLRDEQIREFEFYEKEHLLEYNTTPYSWLGSGGLSYTDEIDRDPTVPVKMSSMMVWGESQETVGVGPDLFKEFVLDYQLDVMKRFGIVDYGCCEGLDFKFDLLIKNIPHLRWLAVSPWCDRNVAAEKLGHNYVYVYKPMPTALTAQSADFDFAERQVRETLEIAKRHNNVVHIVMKDTSTFQNDPTRIERWVKMTKRIAMEMA